MISNRRLSFIVLAFFLLVPSVLMARAASETVIPNDSSVVSGILPNGMRYYIQANTRPADRAELRLAVRAGSIQEDEDQQGLAHFTEHMLFNGTEAYPKNELIDVLESLGMDFGPEINAYTSFDETVYKLFVRTDQWDQFLLGMDVLEQWAAYATLTEEEYEKERGVVYEEYRRGRGANARMFDEIFPVLFDGSRYAERLPIGLPEIILEAPVEAMRRYYEDWYRPDLMAIIAVGDFDPMEVEQVIRNTFSGLENPTELRDRGSYDVPYHDETKIAIVHDPEATGTSVELYVKYEPPTVRYQSDLKTELTEQLTYSMLNQRFTEIARRENPPFIYGYGFSSAWTETTALNGLVAATPDDAALTGLEALLIEAERVQRHGFTEGELQRAKLDFLTGFEAYWRDRDNRESSTFIQPLLDAFLEGGAYPSVDWQWQTVQELVPSITLDDVRDLLADRMTDENRVVILSGPSNAPVASIQEESVRQVVSRVENLELDPWEDLVVDGPLVADPPNPGSIIAEEEIPGTGVTIWTLSNGARVVLKPTDFKEDEILFRGWSPGGSSLVEDERYISALLAVDAAAQGGVGDFPTDALQKALAGKQVGFSPYIQNYEEGMTGSAIPADLETLLQLIYLYQTSPRRDEVAWNSLMSRLAEYLRNREADPQTQYQDLYWSTLYDGHPRSQPLTAEDVPLADLDEALDIYLDRFNGAGDFTYVFVGSINPESMRPMVEQWIGGLPQGRSTESWRDLGVSYPEGVHRASVEAGLEPLSIVTQVWTGEWDGSDRERYLLQSLAAALDMRLLRSIREEASGTYSIGVYPMLEYAPHNTYRFAVRFTCDPHRVEELIGMVQEEIDTFRTALPEDRYAHDVAESQHRTLTENLERNSWWLGQILFAVKNQVDAETLINQRENYDSLDTKSLMETAQRYLDDSQYFEIILYPEAE